MIPLYRDDAFRFRFREERIIPRFHLEGIASGCTVHIHRLDPTNDTIHERLRSAIVGEDGWVDLAEPILVSALSGFVAIVE